MSIDSPHSSDTIAAVATGPGGAVSIIRISGPDADAVVAKLWSGSQLPPPRRLTLGHLRDADGTILDQIMLARMPGPNSYTGEDCVECHCHGGGLVTRQVLAAVFAAGARHADPGEFTRRAFINGKLDLTQAEAVGDLITARSRLAATAANRQLDGALGDQINAMIERLTHVLCETEVRLDFVDEDLDWQSDDAVIAAVDAALAEIDRLLGFRREGQVLHDGVRLAIAGPPNAGKSSLLNRILGRNRAIVTEIAGTTRDTLEETVEIRGIPIRIVDTAGIRDSTDLVERHGIDRSRAALRDSRVVLWLYDATTPASQRPNPISELPNSEIQDPQSAMIAVLNKVDLAPDAQQPDAIRISAATGDGLDSLYDAIEAAVWANSDHDEHDFAVNARHGARLAAAREALVAARDIVRDGHHEVLAVQLRTGLDHLRAIVGQNAEVDVLDTIFSTFCIGK